MQEKVPEGPMDPQQHGLPQIPLPFPEPQQLPSEAAAESLGVTL